MVLCLALGLVPGGRAEGRAKVLARVGRTAIDAAEVDSLRVRRPDSTVRELLRLLVDREVLLLEGEAQGLGEEPVLTARLREFESEALVRCLLDRQAESGHGGDQAGLRAKLAAALRDSLGFVWDAAVAQSLVGRTYATPSRSDSSRTVARWRGGSLTVAEYLVRSRIYGVHNSLADTAAARRAGLQLTIDDLLVAGARRAGLAREAAFQRRLRGRTAELYAETLFARQSAALAAPGDSLIEAFFGQHRDRYQLPAGVRVQEILVDGRVRADSLRDVLAAGADMGTLAAAYTRRQWARRRQGDLGVLTADSPGFGALLPLAFAAEPGVLVGPVPLGSQFSLFRVIERRPARPMHLDEARAAVVQDLHAAAMDHYLEELRQRYRGKIHIEAGALQE